MNYPKIETAFERDKKFVVIPELRRPVLSAISKWIVTEKVDGTNIRLTRDRGGWSIGGRTDNSQFSAKMYTFLEDITKKIDAKTGNILRDFGLLSITLYGEGYGPSIQKGGVYRDDLGFILFDVSVDDRTWLDDMQVSTTASRLGLERVPILGYWTFDEIVEKVKRGIPSEVAKNHGKEFQAEGIVARSIEPIYDRRGERVMLKLKTKDFKPGKR